MNFWLARQIGLERSQNIFILIRVYDWLGNYLVQNDWGAGITWSKMTGEMVLPGPKRLGRWYYLVQNDWGAGITWSKKTGELVLPGPK
jgi:hypothetical protein